MTEHIGTTYVVPKFVNEEIKMVYKLTSDW